MNEYRIRRARPIAAEMHAPGDLEISQRALVLAGLANGPSVLSGFLPAEECMDTIQALRALGVKFDYLSAGDSDLPWRPDGKEGPAGPVRLRVFGIGGSLRPPSGIVDCGRSGTALVLLAGLLAGQPFSTQLAGGAGTALDEVAADLQKMEGSVKTSGPGGRATWLVEGNSRLQGATFDAALPNALRRDALLLAGLYAQGKTRVTDAAAAPDHLERLLRFFQVKTARTALTVSTWGGQIPESRDLSIPGDISYAAPFIAAAAAQPGATLTVRGVGLNDRRTAFLRVLVRMGARVREEISNARGGEPCGNIMISGAQLQRTVMEAGEVAMVHNELPALMTAAALASGGTVIQRAAGTDGRLTRMAHNLRLMGVELAPLQQGLEIKGVGGTPLQPGLMSSGNDPYVAMACAVAGFFTDGETIVDDVQCVESRWFGFEGDLGRFQSREISEGHSVPMLQAVPRVPKAKPPATGKKAGGQ
jgi:3-phosphoshikimate 1-carboxyvinyltransferase